MNLHAAAAVGNLQEIVDLLRTYRIPRCKGVTGGASRNGHFECLKYLHERGFPIDRFGSAGDAAKIGHLEMLQYVFTHGERENVPGAAGIWALRHSIKHIRCFKWILDANITTQDEDRDVYILIHAANEDFATFAYFHHYVADSKPEYLSTFWKFSKTISKDFIEKIDLDDLQWRKDFLHVDLGTVQNSILRNKISYLKGCQNACSELLQHYISTDVIQHILFHYVSCK